MLGLRDALSTYDNQKVTAVGAAVTWRKHTGQGAGNASLARQGEGSDSVSAFGAKDMKRIHLAIKSKDGPYLLGIKYQAFGKRGSLSLAPGKNCSDLRYCSL